MTAGQHDTDVHARIRTVLLTHRPTVGRWLYIPRRYEGGIVSIRRLAGMMVSATVL